MFNINTNITVTLTPAEVEALIRTSEFMVMQEEDLMQHEDDAKVWAPTFEGLRAIEKKVAMELAVEQFVDQYPEVSRTTIRKAVKDVLKARREA